MIEQTAENLLFLTKAGLLSIAIWKIIDLIINLIDKWTTNIKMNKAKKIVERNGEMIKKDSEMLQEHKVRYQPGNRNK